MLKTAPISFGRLIITDNNALDLKQTVKQRGEDLKPVIDLLDKKGFDIKIDVAKKPDQFKVSHSEITQKATGKIVRDCINTKHPVITDNSTALFALETIMNALKLGIKQITQTMPDTKTDTEPDCIYIPRKRKISGLDMVCKRQKRMINCVESTKASASYSIDMLKNIAQKTGRTFTLNMEKEQCSISKPYLPDNTEKTIQFDITKPNSFLNAISQLIVKSLDSV